jgi:hypothetical protein
MKMIYAGPATGPDVASTKWRYNCTRNPNCQTEFFAPITGLCDFQLYMEMPQGFIPASYEINIIATCDGTETGIPATLVKHVVAHHTNGIYAVFSGLQILVPLPGHFFIKVSFFDADDNEIVFYSHDMEVVTCEPLTRVNGCYNDPTVGTEAFDNNSVYYGFPVGLPISGSSKVRYFHTVLVRKGNVIGTATKLSLSIFNYKKNYKTKTTNERTFSSELVPDYYKDEIVAVIARGNISIGGKAYQLSEEVSLQINNDDSRLWIMDVALSELINTSFSCKDTDCLFDACIPEPACCAPTDVVAVQSSGCTTDTISFSFRLHYTPTQNYPTCTGSLSQQSVSDVEFWLSAPAPRDLVIFFGAMYDNTFAGGPPYPQYAFGYNMPFALPAGVGGDSYYTTGWGGVSIKGNPFVARIPAGATHHIYSMYGCRTVPGVGTFCYNGVFQLGGEPIGGVRMYPQPDGWVAHQCRQPIVKFWVNGECLELSEITNADGIPVEIVNL